jgi:hypothetical protein
MADTTNSGTQNLRYPTDYNLLALNLITPLSDGNVNLMPFMLELNLFEDVFSSTISGEVVISDALGLISHYLLNGTEFIQVQLQKTTGDAAGQYISRNYRVYKISKRVLGESNNYENYIINFISEEFMLSEQFRISKGYKSTKISDIITDVLNNYLKVGNGNTKKISVQPTLGLYDFVLPNKKIFETINWLSTYALPGTNNLGADMMFFENNYGYNFSSLQSLFQQTPYQTYKFDPKNITETNMNEKLTNVMDFEVLEFFNTLNGVTNGTFSNKVITIDPLLRTSNTGIFNYANYFDSSQSKTLNGYPPTNNYQNRLNVTLYNSAPVTPAGLEMGTLRMAATNSNQKKNPYVSQSPDDVANDINLEKYLPNRVAQFALANYMRIKLTVPGDPLLTVGMVVTFNTYQIDPTSYTQSGSNATRIVDPFYSGNYLVAATRHIVKNNSYITIVELIKDSVKASYPTFDSTNATLQKYVDGNQI